MTESSRSSVGCWNTMPSSASAGTAIARHVVAHHLDAAGIGGEQAGQELEQRRLAGAVRPEQRDELAGLRRQADAIDRADRPVALDDIVEQQCSGVPRLSFVPHRQHTARCK